MLRYLKISHLAIIDEVEVEFQEGFNVLTGETGAGKSILIGALNLLLGARASQDMIRTGEEEAQLEGLFELPDTSALPQDIDCPLDSSGELLLSRRISRSGRSRCSVNGNLATLGMLQAIGRSLVSIFGQHEHQVLLDADEHGDILDKFGGLHDHREKTATAYSRWNAAEKDLSRALRDLEDLERAGRENAAAAEELSEASLQPGEEDALAEERSALRNAVQIRERAFEAYHALYSRSGSLIEGFSEVRKAVEFLANAHTKFGEVRENLEDAIYRIEDVALELRGIAETSQSDPARLEQIEERLTLIRKLKKKYGKDVEGLIDHLHSLSKEAGDVLEARSAVRRLKGEVETFRSAYLSAARELSKARQKAAKILETAMKKELSALAMPGASFSVTFGRLEEDKGTAAGLEKAEFYLASNPGEASRPLARIASGGELSRIMLALKALEADSGGASTVIFDEVDAGIGGHTASAVGTRLARVSKHQQVLCVTHLHQIAALADRHMSVSKSVSEGRTRIKVTPLNKEQRVEELSRMLGAKPGSKAVRDHVTGLMEDYVSEVTQ